MATHILYCIPSNTYGGAHNQVIRLHEPLRSLGYTSSVVVPSESGDAAKRLVAAGIRTIQLPLLRLRATRRLRPHFELVRRFDRQVRELTDVIAGEGADVVQIHGLTSLDAAIASRRAGRALVWQIIDTRPPKALRTTLTPFVNRLSDKVMTTGKGLLCEYPGLDESKVVPFFPPVNSDIFKASLSERKHRRDRFGVAESDFVVAVLANVNPQKGLECALRAAAKLSAEPGTRVLIRGRTAVHHERYRLSLDRLAQQLGLVADTFGPLPEGITPATFFQLSDCAVQTSVRRSEGIPTALLEAMATELPVISTQVGAVADVVTMDRGIIVEPESAEGVAAAVKKLRAMDRDQRALMGRSGRAFVETNCSLEVCAAQHAMAYEGALQVTDRRRRYAL